MISSLAELSGVLGSESVHEMREIDKGQFYIFFALYAVPDEMIVTIVLMACDRWAHVWG